MMSIQVTNFPNTILRRYTMQSLNITKCMGGLALMVISPKKIGMGNLALLYVHIEDYSTTFEVF